MCYRFAERPVKARELQPTELRFAYVRIRIDRPRKRNYSLDKTLAHPGLKRLPNKEEAIH